ncbi:PIAS3 ligase, partial [Pterocles burchelli]|nr:PIAS3 ligase [Pterocles burchelli]
TAAFLFLQHTGMICRVSELRVLLGCAGRKPSGRRHELLAKALELLKAGCSPAVQMKIKELYRRRFPRKIPNPSDLSMLHIPAGQLPSATALTPGTVCHLPYDHGSAAAVPTALLPPVPALGPKREGEAQHLSAPIHPLHPDVTMRRLPFYDVYDELIKPTTLASTTSQRFEEAHFTFALTPQQVQQILTSRDILPGAKCDYTTQVQLRLGLWVPGRGRPPRREFLVSRVISLSSQGYLPPTKNGVEPKRPSRPVNITPLARLSATVPNTIVVNWSSEFGRSYSLSVYLVKQLTSVTLLQKLRAKGIRNPDHSRALSESPRGGVTALGPVLGGQSGSEFPNNGHMGLNFQVMATWVEISQCGSLPPVLSPARLFMEILNSCSNCDEIQFLEDGSWSPMKPKKEKAEVCTPAVFSAIEGTAALVNNSLFLGNSSESKKPVEVIDLTLDSSSDEEEPPTKKPCPGSSPVPSAAGPKGALNIDHQPTSVLRSPPMAALGGDYLSNLPVPDYHPSYPLSSELQGNDRGTSSGFGDTHWYHPSVITSLDEQDALSPFFQYRGAAGAFLPVTPLPPARISSIVSAGALRESPGHGGTLANAAAALPGCRPDVISLD